MLLETVKTMQAQFKHNPIYRKGKLMQMTRKQALAELLAKVEVGNWDTFWEGARGTPVHAHQFEVDDAYNGSFDASLALHNAVLPGWPYTINENGAWTDSKRGLRQLGFRATSKDNPARAWLCAILKALIGQEV